MNELIKIEVRDNQQLVSGRELHKFLEVGTEYMKWFSRIIEKYNFIENKDFTVIVKNDEDDTAFGGIRKSTDHLMTLNLAKEIARLFTWLRDNGFLIKRLGTDYNMPTQKSMELELFEIKETAVTHADGHTTINKTPKVTGKGQIYFINKFKEA